MEELNMEKVANSILFSQAVSHPNTNFSDQSRTSAFNVVWFLPRGKETRSGPKIPAVDQLEGGIFWVNGPL